MTDIANPVTVIHAVIMKNSLLDEESAMGVAIAINRQLELTTETASVSKGLEYLSLPEMYRWVSAWRRR